MLTQQPYVGFGRGTKTLPLAVNGNYERACVIAEACTVTPDAIVGWKVQIKPRYAAGEGAGGFNEFSFELVNAAGTQPEMTLVDLDLYYPGDTSFYSTRRWHFSEDGGITWTAIANQTPNFTTNVSVARHNAPFTANRVRIGRGRQVSVHRIGQWLAQMEATYPDFFDPAPSSTAFTPTSLSAGYEAQEFIINELSSQVDNQGRTVPAAPLYGLKISDSTLSPTGGRPAKDIITLFGGVHAGEDAGDVAMLKLVEAICDSTAWGINIRANTEIIFYPCCNPIGRSGGHLRAQWTLNPIFGRGNDINRNFQRTLPSGLESVDKIMAALALDIGSTVPIAHFDCHGTFQNDFAVVLDAGVALHDEFATRLITYFGAAIDDDANTPDQSTAAYFRDLGTPLYITMELGDPSPVTDTQINNYSIGVAKTISSMLTDGLI